MSKIAETLDFTRFFRVQHVFIHVELMLNPGKDDKNECKRIFKSGIQTE